MSYRSETERRIQEARIQRNEGRDEDGDLIYIDGKPHPASGLKDIPATMQRAIEGSRFNGLRGGLVGASR